MALAEALQARLHTTPGLPTRTDTIVRGLRRLAAQDGRDGGQYGRWLLRAFGLPADVQRWLAYLGQYHSRFADLPTWMRLEQLRLWSRPPITQTPLVAWIHLGVASVRLRQRDTDACDQRLDLAMRTIEGAGPAAGCEAHLLRAWRCLSQGEPAATDAALDAVATLLSSPGLSATDRLVCHARMLNQRAQRISLPRTPQALQAAQVLLQQIPADSGLPFVDFRRAEGLARIHHLLGEHASARRLAREAMEHAADGGFVRLRILALRQLARSSPPAEQAKLRARARHLAGLLSDDDLLLRADW